MIRGGSAQFKFRLPYNFSDLEAVKVVFWQPENNGPSPSRPLPITKILKQCSQSNVPNELVVTLSQEETLRFRDDKKAYVQLRGTTVEGIPIVSKIKIITVYPVYDDTIIDGEVLPTPGYNGLVYLDGRPVV